MTQQAEAPTPPMPVPDALTQFFWDGVKERKLLILQCQSCGHYIHTPKPVCRFCLSADLTPKQVSGRASLFSWTVAMQPFHPYWADKIPYIYAIVELAEQPELKLATNIVDCPEGELKASMPLEVVFREIAP